ncbi:MAG: DUF2798 domain-containing protein [Moraxellaceae bacterium]|nr:DUF2798 domain-containing protein [Moraxellaceae bacterium]
MTSEQRAHLLFSACMAAVMVPVMTFVVTFVNIGFVGDFVFQWFKAFVIAYAVACPMIFFFAPAVRRFTTRLLHSQQVR